MTKKLIFFIILYSCYLMGETTYIDQQFAQANAYMVDEEYSDAVILYEKIIATGTEHPDLYYNMGNGYYRLGLIGQAVWSYEKALQFTPNDPDVRYNLEITNLQVVDRINIPDTVFLLKYYRQLKNRLTLFQWIISGSIFLLIASVFGSLFKLRWLPASRLTFVPVIMIVLTIICHGIALDKYWTLSDEKTGIIIANEINAYSVPFEKQEATQFRIHSGIKVDIHNIQPKWVEISLLDGNKGWVKSASVREL